MAHISLTSVDDETPTIIDNLKHRLEYLNQELYKLVSKERSAEELEEVEPEFNLFKIDQDLVKKKLQELEIAYGDSGNEVHSKIQELKYSVDKLERKMNEMKVWYEESSCSHPYHTSSCYGPESSQDPLNLDPKDDMDKAKSELKVPMKSVENGVDQIEDRDSVCTEPELEPLKKIVEPELSKSTTSAAEICSGFESDINTSLDKMMEMTGLSGEAKMGSRISLVDMCKEAMGFSEESTSGTGHSQLSPSVNVDKLIQFRSTLEDTCIKARARIELLDEHLLKLDKYFEDLASKKRRMTPGIEAKELKNADEDYVNDKSNNQGALNVAGTSLEPERVSSPSNDDNERRTSRNAEILEPNIESEENA